jgi:hypothetical protein
MADQLPSEITPARVCRLLTAAEFQRLADVPPETEWFANLTNLHTKRAYEDAVGDFVRFTGIARPAEFRTVTRAHVIAWRDDLKTRLTKRGEPWNDSSIPHRLAALASLFQYLCEKTPSPITRSKASSGRKRQAAKARPVLLAITRRANCSMRLQTTRSRASAIGRSCPRCYSTRCGARNYASSRSVSMAV